MDFQSNFRTWHWTKKANSLKYSHFFVRKVKIKLLPNKTPRWLAILPKVLERLFENLFIERFSFARWSSEVRKDESIPLYADCEVTDV